MADVYKDMDDAALSGSVTIDGEASVEIAASDGDNIAIKDSTGTNALSISAAGAAKVDGSAVTQPVSAASLPLPSGAATSALQTQPGVDIGDVTINNSTGGSAVNIQDGGNSITVDGTVNANGGTASGSSLTAAPLTIGGLGKTANPTAVSDGQVVNSLHDKLGKQVVVGSLRDLKSNQQTTITSSTAETTIVTADSTNFLDLYGLVLANTSATATSVTIKDATSGTTRFVFHVPAGDTRGFMLPESAAHKQASNNNNWTATCGTSVASLNVTALFVKNL